MQIRREASKDEVEISINGVDEKLIYSQQGKVDESSKLFQVNTSSLRTGMYIMEILVNDRKVTKRFSKLLFHLQTWEAASYWRPFFSQ